MNQILDILDAFDGLCALNKPCAMATVIAIEGSAYRRPGARMLIAEDGRTWGGISGGCLERDVTRRGRGVIETGIPIICRYDTTDDEQLSAGPATGCRGMVELLVEPLSRSRREALEVLARVFRERRVLTVASTIPEFGRAGDADARWVLDAGGKIESPLHGPHLGSAAVEALHAVMRDGQPRRIRHRVDFADADLFIERLAPPQALVIYGAGPDAIPLIRIAKTIGWHVTVIGSRPATASANCLALADASHVTSSESPSEGLRIDAQAAVVIMTHHFPRDCAILQSLPASLRYLGILGPRSRTDSLLLEVSRGDARKIHAPIGLDLGAETPEEIALSIVAEIQRVITRSAGGSLRDKDGPIHSARLAATLSDTARPARELIELA